MYLCNNFQAPHPVSVSLLIISGFQSGRKQFLGLGMCVCFTLVAATIQIIYRLLLLLFSTMVISIIDFVFEISILGKVYQPTIHHYRLKLLLWCSHCSQLGTDKPFIYLQESIIFNCDTEKYLHSNILA